MKPRFLLDEHLSRAIQRQLRRLESQIEVLVVGDDEAPPIETPDPDLLIWMERNNYILVTKNRSTMPMHFADHLTAGRHVPGVLCIRRGITIGRLIDELHMIWYASGAEEYRDRILFIPL